MCKQVWVKVLANWPRQIVGTDPHFICLERTVCRLVLLLLAGLIRACVVCHVPAPYRHGMTSADSNTPLPSQVAPRIVLLVAHGSRNPLAAVEHAQLCEKVQAESNEAQSIQAQALPQAGLEPQPIQVRPAYLELAEPSIADAIDTAVEQGAVHIRLLPHFLNSGNHVMRDLPEAVAEAERKHPGVSIELAEHLGADAGLVSLLTTRVLAD
ncbi:MAG: hypothetical protein F2518_05595 [Actinobacteria bacterium]|nr:hypothetical protein [Actinomycetota bacterium]MTA63799.1 hypothetical protein [Actinomycetota bacterium]